MTSIQQSLTEHHHFCDGLLAAAEGHVVGLQWDAATVKFEEFQRALARHLSIEEDILFTAFEARTGMRGGPTQMMVFEHGQMRDLLSRIAAALAVQNAADCLGLSDTLWLLTQQHNMKEETMLYPMLDRSLGADDPAVADVLGLLARAA
jgi:hemerythrin-like domain-containing protein